MTNQATQEFLDSTDIDGPLSPEQAATLMALATGDTTNVDSSALPGSATATDDKAEDGAQDDKGKGEDAEAGKPSEAVGEGEQTPVLMAKDGVHTIDYQKLVDARQAEQHWKAQAQALQEKAEAAERELNDLRAAAQTRADNGQAPTTTDNLLAQVEAAEAAGVDMSIFGDFSEEAMVKGINMLVQQQVAAKLEEAMKPLKERHEQTVKDQEAQAADAHRDAVLAAHPDAVSIWQSQELQAWIGDKPGYEQAAIRGVLDEGATADLIAVFDRYKAEMGIKPASSPKAGAKAAIAAASAPVPASLSAIPGGRTGATSAHDQMEAMDTQSLAATMLNGMSPAQIEAFLNRQI